MEEIIVHPRIHKRHPNINEEDVKITWKQIVRWSYWLGTEKDVIVAVGLDG